MEANTIVLRISALPWMVALRSINGLEQSRCFSAYIKYQHQKDLFRPVPDLHDIEIMNTVAGAALDFNQLPSLTTNCNRRDLSSESDYRERNN